MKERESTERIGLRTVLVTAAIVVAVGCGLVARLFITLLPLAPLRFGILLVLTPFVLIYLLWYIRRVYVATLGKK